VTLADPSSTVRVRRLVEDDFDAYLALRDASFGYPRGDEVRQTLLGRLPSTWGAFDGEHLVASLADPRFEVFLAGVRVQQAGIAAVQTAPEQRRRGIAARLMRRALEAARDDGIGWSLLYPFDPGFYARYGWQTLPTGTRLDLPPSRLGRPDEVGAERVTGDLRPQLQDLHLRCAAEWNFTNARTLGNRDVWGDMQSDPGQQGLAYRFGDAYVVLRQRFDETLRGTRLEVIDLGYASRAGRDRLFGFLASFEGQAARVTIDLPSSDPLVWDWAGWHPAAGRPTLMARIADLRVALAALRWPPTASADRDPVPVFTMRVRDAFAPWNEGTYRVEVGADGTTVAAATGSETDLDVRALPLLVSGAATPDAVRRAGLAEGEPRPLEALARLAAGRTPYQAPEDFF
jgi:predicted acetyltransferase